MRNMKKSIQSARLLTAALTLSLILGSGGCAAASGKGKNGAHPTNREVLAAKVSPAKLDVLGIVISGRENFVDHSQDEKIQLALESSGRKIDPQQGKKVVEAANRTERLLFEFIQDKTEAREVVKSAADCLNKGYDAGGFSFSNVALPVYLESLSVIAVEPGHEDLVRIVFEKLFAMRERAGREYREDILVSKAFVTSMRAALVGTSYEEIARTFVAMDRKIRGLVIYDREAFVDHSQDYGIQLASDFYGRSASPRQLWEVDKTSIRTEQLVKAFARGEVEASVLMESAADCLDRGAQVGGLLFSNTALPAYLQALVAASYEPDSDELVRTAFDKLESLKSKIIQSNRPDVFVSPKAKTALKAAFEGTPYEELAKAYSDPRAM